ncbi:hypothetical protein EZY14_019375 [Kordia sp. TARA_039_SRF]|nr:hypothetical protein EZY14_019375 [Kordia sp. TARA_039_SRF]
MSIIIKKFYNLFWNNKACQNLFLLSKEELLDTRTVDIVEKPFNYSLPRIIISNVEPKEDYALDTIKIRNENYNIQIEDSMNSNMEGFGIILKEFVGEKFQESIIELFSDLEEKPLKFVSLFFKILVNENKREQRIIDFLQEYRFIGPHVNDLDNVVERIKNKLIPNKKNDLVTDTNIATLLEVIKTIKEMYINVSYKTLYNTNQVLVNALQSEDDFESRIKLFDHLYDSKIIKASSEDSFIECTHCDSGTYKGVFQLHLNPNKLKNLVCPVCANEVKYYVPYELDQDIYEIIREKDGLLQNALLNLLENSEIAYKTNSRFLDDIEIDCIFDKENKSILIETKMYKINTAKEKLISKLKKHFGKLLEDVRRLKQIPEFTNKQIIPILLVNIIDTELLQEVEKELKEINKDQISQSIKILNITTFREEM